MPDLRFRNLTCVHIVQRKWDDTGLQWMRKAPSVRLKRFGRKSATVRTPIVHTVACVRLLVVSRGAPKESSRGLPLAVSLSVVAYTKREATSET